MLVAGLGAGLLSMGHSPYRQWYVYRRVRLFILTSAADPESYPLGESVAAFLLSHLPETRAMAARARDSVEIVKLLASEQLDVALLTPADARATLGGEDPFGAYGPVQLRALASLGSHLMVCRDDYPAANAYQIAKTLAEHWRRPAPALLAGSAPADPAGSLPASEETDPPFPIPMHPGASEYHEGRQRNR